MEIGRKKNGKISHSLYAISILPLLAFGLIIAVLGYYLIQNAMHAEAEEELKAVAFSFNQMWDEKYPGDYALVGDGALSLYKGEADVTRDYALSDVLKDRTGLDVSLFYQDTRIMTTLRDKEGTRLVGTGAAPQVVAEVLQGGKEAFYNNTRIYSTKYLTYYMPLENEDGSVVGMLAIGKDGDQVAAQVNRALMPLLIADIVLMLFVMYIIFSYAKGVAKTLEGINTFLNDAAKGNAEAELSDRVTRRNDELGAIGASVVDMHRALRDTMEKDPLTGLFNRRSTYRKIKAVMAKAAKEDRPYSVAIGDIDFFKKVNDTYGHDAGDEVLRQVANALREHMKQHGFVCRWGGEEFLMVFDHVDGAVAEASLNELLAQIREREIIYVDQRIRITMSFGVCTAQGDDFDAMTKVADERLYYAKEHGRNQVIRFMPGEDGAVVLRETVEDIAETEEAGAEISVSGETEPTKEEEISLDSDIKEEAEESKATEE